MKKVIVLADLKRPQVERVVQKVLPWLKGQVAVTVFESQRIKLNRVEADFIIVFGGDGSILATMRRLEDNAIPVVGVNVGHLGFMAGVSPEQFRRRMKQIIAGEYTISERMLLSCVLKTAKKQERFFALNDAVLERGNLSRMLNIGAWVNGEYLTTYAGDGLVISTPTGSTAHSLAAGGPILHVCMEGFIVNPLAPHTLTNRPMVLPGDGRIDIRLNAGNGAAQASFDGQIFRAFRPGDELEIRRADHKLQLIQFADSGFFKTLRDKLGWGGSPGENWKDRRSNRGCRY